MRHVYAVANEIALGEQTAQDARARRERRGWSREKEEGGDGGRGRMEDIKKELAGV